jgi:hypothetical protein
VVILQELLYFDATIVPVIKRAVLYWKNHSVYEFVVSKPIILSQFSPLLKQASFLRQLVQ